MSALKLIKESSRTECLEFLDFKRNIQVRPHYGKREQEKRNKKIIFYAFVKQRNVSLSTFMSI